VGVSRTLLNDFQKNTRQARGVSAGSVSLLFSTAPDSTTRESFSEKNPKSWQEYHHEDLGIPTGPPSVVLGVSHVEPFPRVCFQWKEGVSVFSCAIGCVVGILAISQCKYYGDRARCFEVAVRMRGRAAQTTYPDSRPAAGKLTGRSASSNGKMLELRYPAQVLSADLDPVTVKYAGFVRLEKRKSGRDPWDLE